MMHRQLFLLFVCLLAGTLRLNAQDDPRYNFFSIKDDDMYWSYTYRYAGNSDSLRSEIVRMLKSKYYTYNVFKTGSGYNGEIKHYRVNCRKYGRTFLNTPRIFWSGEWSGKFVIEVLDSMYRLTVYALYVEQIEKNPGNYRMERLVKGRYFEMVTRRDRQSFKKNELSNLQLMSLSLRDQFDIANTVNPTE